MYLIGLISLYTNKEKVGDSFVRKAEDLIATIDLIQLGHYRPALRNMFSLLDGEHKKCADVLNGYNQKKKDYKHGIDRANRIANIVESMCTDYYISVWRKIDKLYKDMLGNKKVENLPNRNSIVHGDYNNEGIDVSGYDVVKVIFLYITMRTIADYMCIMEEFIINFNEEFYALLSNMEI